ncbi:uncharacterized protein LOC120072993 isoform X1 [Benincasa hispida]|uniref:uncharacterized protein LOC120072993 isoform X1 n=1 Tax=Benincasa hispida TaxID=102211 RepID=UPI00190114E1|nr:uncharacterized protein LOC120072993 isoform X1 [Benincasa hispida]
MHRQLHASHLRQIQPYNLWSSSSVSCIVSLSALSATATPFVILAFRDWWLVVQQIRGCFGKSLMCLAQVSSKKKWEVELIVLDFKVAVSSLATESTVACHPKFGDLRKKLRLNLF